MLVYCLLLICCFTISPFCWVNFFDSLDKFDFDLFIWFSLVIIKFNYKRKLSCLHIYEYGKLFSFWVRYRSGSGSEMFGRPLLSIFNEKLFLEENLWGSGLLLLTMKELRFWKNFRSWGEALFYERSLKNLLIEGVKLSDYHVWIERRNSAKVLLEQSSLKFA